MKKKEWNEGLDHLDPDLVERYVSHKERLAQDQKKHKDIWLRIGALAACFVLILSSAIVIAPMLRGSGQGGGSTDVPGNVVPPSNDHAPIIFDATVSPESLSGSSFEFIVGSSVLLDDGIRAEPPSFDFIDGIVVKAKVVKNYPDKYYKLDVDSKNAPRAYRLIEMETLEVINGENVPKYFLYLIRDYIYVDMSVYDSLLISMTQRGVENYVLKNGSQNRMEYFELPVFADTYDTPELGNIVAFSDGIFDESLWQNETWIYGYQFAKGILDNPQPNRPFFVARGDSESTVISAIKKKFEKWQEDTYQAPSVMTLDLKTQAAKEAFEYVKPFANGVFSQTCYNNGRLVFRRYINGCQTEETVSINLLTGEVNYSDVRYTKEDMTHMENISAHISEMASEYAEKLPIPPHTDLEGKTLLGLNLYGWYVKIDGKLYGVVKTAWKYQDEDTWYVQYYDESYVLYDMSSSSATDISRDDLIDIVGTRNIYLGEYGVAMEMPQC